MKRVRQKKKGKEEEEEEKKKKKKNGWIGMEEEDLGWFGWLYKRKERVQKGRKEEEEKEKEERKKGRRRRGGGEEEERKRDPPGGIKLPYVTGCSPLFEFQNPTKVKKN
jgi:hypothetical protein